MDILILKILIPLLGYIALWNFASYPRKKKERTRWRFLGFLVLLATYYVLFHDVQSNSIKQKEMVALKNTVGYLQQCVDSLKNSNCNEIDLKETFGYNLEELKLIAKRSYSNMMLNFKT